MSCSARHTWQDMWFLRSRTKLPKSYCRSANTGEAPDQGPSSQSMALLVPRILKILQAAQHWGTGSPIPGYMVRLSNCQTTQSLGSQFQTPCCWCTLALENPMLDFMACFSKGRIWLCPGSRGCLLTTCVPAHTKPKIKRAASWSQIPQLPACSEAMCSAQLHVCLLNMLGEESQIREQLPNLRLPQSIWHVQRTHMQQSCTWAQGARGQRAAPQSQVPVPACSCHLFKLKYDTNQPQGTSLWPICDFITPQIARTYEITIYATIKSINGSKGRNSCTLRGKCIL